MGHGPSCQANSCSANQVTSRNLRNPMVYYRVSVALHRPISRYRLIQSSTSQLIS